MGAVRHWRWFDRFGVTQLGWRLGGGVEVGGSWDICSPAATTEQLEHWTKELCQSLPLLSHSPLEPGQEQPN